MSKRRDFQHNLIEAVKSAKGNLSEIEIIGTLEATKFYIQSNGMDEYINS